MLESDVRKWTRPIKELQSDLGDIVGLDRATNYVGDFGQETGSYLASRALLNVRGANVQAAAAHNRKIILQSLRVLKTAERSDLADITGLTTPAVFKIVKELLHEGLVISPKTRRGAKGQPAAVLAVNPDTAFSIGVSVEQDGLSLVVVDFAGEVRRHCMLKDTNPGQRTLGDFLAGCLADRAFDLSKITGIGLTAGHAQALPSMTALLDRPLRVERRVIAAAHAEATLDRRSTSDPFFYLDLGDQLSGALVVDGHVIRGSLNRENAPAALPQLNPFRSSRTDLGKMLGDAASLPAFLQFLDDKGLKVSALDEIDLGDGSVEEAVDEWIDIVADLLYVPLLSIICCLNLSSVLIGGPLPQAIVARLCRGLSARLSLNLGLNWSEMAVRPAPLGGLAPAVGAALLAFEDRW